VAGAARQVETVYEAMCDALASEGTGPDAVVAETIFFRQVREHVDVARAARARVLAGTGLATWHAATTCVGQPPLDSDARLELAAVAIVPRSPGTSSGEEVTRSAACACAACALGLRARVVRLGEHRSLYTGNILGSGRDAFEEAYDMFRTAEGLLSDAGMSFADVIRTWIHVRDIGRDYDALNRARRDFFQHYGLQHRPASTGIQGTPPSEAHDFSLSLYAVTSPGPLDVTPMSSPSLTEAWNYGADFSRGLRVVEANKVALYLSGTASIDEAGRTAHPGDFAGQADRMLHNVASLLAKQGATFRDVVSGVTYLKHPGDAPVLHALCRQRGFDGFPCAVVEAPLCRPDLLCETEAVAALPLTPLAGTDRG
jgi:enamine deaminase RidA (YjgF/YER057c/UK114 family)